MNIKIICAALMLLTASIAYAQQAQNSSKNPKPPVEEATAKASGADTNQGYNEARPLPVRLLNTGKSDAEAKQDEEERKEESLNGRLMTQLTGGMFLVAVFQALLFLWQLSYMRKNLADTKIAAEAAKQGAEATAESVKVMKDIAIRQMRAYVFVTEAEIINFDNSKPPQIKIVIANQGQTPAYNLTQWSVLGFAEENIVPPSPELKLSKTNLPPKGQLLVLLDTTENPIPAELIPTAKDELISGRASLWLWGEINYTDAFDVRRCTKWRLKFIGNGNPTDSQFSGCEEGNEAT